MNSAAIDQVFSVPFRHLWSTSFNGEQTASQTRPLGLARFVGDEPNLLLKYLISDGPAARSLANSQWPMVLFGPSGTGKTSLAMTVISDLIDRYQQTTDRDLAESVLPFEAKRRPESNPHNHKPIFLTALDFDRRYRAALETDSIADFRQRLIDCGGLVIDDIHKLADKSAAQNEFVLILEAMCRKNRPLVVTLDTPPQICLGLSPQLISRLSGGLSIPVNPPGPLARLEIIRDLAEINDVHLTDDAAQLLVDRLKVTVPKLDHVFAQIKTKLRIRSEDPLQPIDAAKLMLIFKKSNSDQEKLSQLIIKLAAAEFDLKVSELKSNSRKQSIVMARGVSIYLIRVLLGTSFLKIGSYLGGRDHSTIMHAFRKLENLVTNNDHFADDNSVKNSVTKLKQRLTEQFASQINFF